MTVRMECPIAWCNGDIDNHGGVGQEPSEWLHVDHGRDIVHGAAIYRTQKGSAPVRWEMVVGGRVVAAGADLAVLAEKLRDIAGAVEAMKFEEMSRS